MEVGVVGNLEVGTDIGESVEGDVLQTLVVVDDKSTVDLGELGGSNGLEVVALEDTEVSHVDLSQGGDGKGADGTDGDVVGRLKFGERDVDHGVVEGKSEEVGDVGDVGEVDGIDFDVVGKHDGRGLFQVDAVQVLELGVLDVEVVALGDTGGELQVAEVGQTQHDKAVHLLELGHGQSSELGDVVDAELSLDGLEVLASKTLDVGVVLDGQVALDGLEATKIDVIGHTGGEGNAAGEGCAGGDGSGIAAIFDGCGSRGAAGGWGLSVGLGRTGRWLGHTVGRAGDCQGREGESEKRHVEQMGKARRLLRY